MSRARRKNNRLGIRKRLVKDSLILSYTSSVSSRVVRVFEEGALAPLTNSVKKVDHFVRDKVTKPVLQKLELRKKFTMPARNAVSKFIMNNSFFKKITQLRTKFMNSSLRSVGIFLLTFGIYSGAIFLLKNYINLSVGKGNTDDLIVAALAVIVGLLLSLFGDKSIIYSLANGVITGRLLSGVLGVNDITLDKALPTKAKTSLGISFLLGSLLGVLTMFFTGFQVFFGLLTAIIVITIFNIPEFGLLFTMSLMAIVSVQQLYVLAWVTLVSYLIKCIRLKRNLRFGTADSLVFILLLMMLVKFVFSGGGIIRGEQYILCFTALYFPVKNMIVSKKLLNQTFNALTVGAFLGMIGYVIKELNSFIPYSQLRLLSQTVSINSLNVDMLAVLVASILPFAFYTFSSKTNQKRNLLFVLLSIGCAFVSDNLVFYGVIMASLFIYIGVSYKAPAGSLLSALIVIPTVLWFLSNFTLSNSIILFDSQKNDSLVETNRFASSFWEASFDIIGVAITLLIITSVVFVLQRIFASVVLEKDVKNRLTFGAVGSSVVIVLLMSSAFNIFADVRMLCMLWFVLGLCGSAYKIYSIDKISQEVHDDAEA